mmetsp:Transcript_41273/g.53247  ORF Transcript_41273/g.53247 Transcript_41273/m.53247 type:complete len:1473 (+) Transcript_41273:84-4502(+)
MSTPKNKKVKIKVEEATATDQSFIGLRILRHFVGYSGECCWGVVSNEKFVDGKVRYSVDFDNGTRKEFKLSTIHEMAERVLSAQDPTGNPTGLAQTIQQGHYESLLKQIAFEEAKKKQVEDAQAAATAAKASKKTSQKNKTSVSQDKVQKVPKKEKVAPSSSSSSSSKTTIVKGDSAQKERQLGKTKKTRTQSPDSSRQRKKPAADRSSSSDLSNKSLDTKLDDERSKFETKKKNEANAVEEALRLIQENQKKMHGSDITQNQKEKLNCDSDQIIINDKKEQPELHDDEIVYETEDDENEKLINSPEDKKEVKSLGDKLLLPSTTHIPRKKNNDNLEEEDENAHSKIVAFNDAPEIISDADSVLDGMENVKVADMTKETLAASLPSPVSKVLEVLDLLKKIDIEDVDPRCLADLARLSVPKCLGILEQISTNTTITQSWKGSSLLEKLVKREIEGRRSSVEPFDKTPVAKEYRSGDYDGAAEEANYDNHHSMKKRGITRPEIEPYHRPGDYDTANVVVERLRRIEGVLEGIRPELSNRFDRTRNQDSDKESSRHMYDYKDRYHKHHSEKSLIDNDRYYDRYGNGYDDQYPSRRSKSKSAKPPRSASRGYDEELVQNREDTNEPFPPSYPPPDDHYSCPIKSNRYRTTKDYRDIVCSRDECAYCRGTDHYFKNCYEYLSLPYHERNQFLEDRLRKISEIKRKEGRSSRNRGSHYGLCSTEQKQEEKRDSEMRDQSLKKKQYDQIRATLDPKIDDYEGACIRIDDFCRMHDIFDMWDYDEGDRHLRKLPNGSLYTLPPLIRSQASIDILESFKLVKERSKNYYNKLTSVSIKGNPKNDNIVGWEDIYGPEYQEELALLQANAVRERNEAYAREQDNQLDDDAELFAPSSPIDEPKESPPLYESDDETNYEVYEEKEHHKRDSLKVYEYLLETDRSHLLEGDNGYSYFRSDAVIPKEEYLSMNPDVKDCMQRLEMRSKAHWPANYQNPPYYEQCALEVYEFYKSHSLDRGKSNGSISNYGDKLMIKVNGAYYFKLHSTNNLVNSLVKDDKIRKLMPLSLQKVLDGVSQVSHDFHLQSQTYGFKLAESLDHYKDTMNRIHDFFISYGLVDLLFEQHGNIYLRNDRFLDSDVWCEMSPQLQQSYGIVRKYSNKLERKLHQLRDGDQIKTYQDAAQRFYNYCVTKMNSKSINKLLMKHGQTYYFKLLSTKTFKLANVSKEDWEVMPSEVLRDCVQVRDMSIFFHHVHQDQHLDKEMEGGSNIQIDGQKKMDGGKVTHSDSFSGGGSVGSYGHTYIEKETRSVRDFESESRKRTRAACEQGNLETKLDTQTIETYSNNTSLNSQPRCAAERTQATGEEKSCEGISEDSRMKAVMLPLADGDIRNEEVLGPIKRKQAHDHDETEGQVMKPTEDINQIEEIQDSHVPTKKPGFYVGEDYFENPSDEDEQKGNLKEDLLSDMENLDGGDSDVIETTTKKKKP